MKLAYDFSIDRFAEPAEANNPLASWYAPGLSDELGDRLLMFDNSSAPSLELLRFRRALTATPGFEVALRRRVERLSRFRHPSFTTVRAVEYLGPNEGLALVSNYTPGKRLSEVLQETRGPAFAMALIQQLIPALASLRQHGEDLGHGALSASRIVITPDGRLMILEHVLGPALERLQLPASRLRSELGIAVPSAQLRLDSRTDSFQLGVIALSLLLGRRVSPEESQDDMAALLDQVARTADRESPGLFRRLRAWLERALQLDGQAFESVPEAFDDLSDRGDIQRALLHQPWRDDPAPIDVPMASSGSVDQTPASITHVTAEDPPVVTQRDEPSDAGPTTSRQETTEPVDPLILVDPVEDEFETITLEPDAPVDDPETEVRALETEVRALETEVRVHETEVRALETEVRALETEVRVPEPEVRAQETEGRVHELEQREMVRSVVQAPEEPPAEKEPWLPVSKQKSQETAHDSLFIEIDSRELQPIAEADTFRQPVPQSRPSEKRRRAILFRLSKTGQREVVRALVFALGMCLIGEGFVIAGLVLTRGAGAAAAIVIDTATPGADVVVDGRSAGVTPLQVNIGASTRSIRIVDSRPQNPIATSPQPDTGRGLLAAPETRAPDVAAAASRPTGAVRLLSPIDLEVFEGDRRLGSSGAGVVSATAGRHEFELVNSLLGYRSRQVVNVKRGQVVPVRVSPPNGRLSVNAVPWAEVWIDGKSMGETPLGNLSVPLGEHEIIFRHPELGEQRRIAVVRLDGVTRVSANLQR